MKPMNIAVLLSGGVDSSLALKLLANQGHHLKAFYLKIWLEDELAYLGNCPWEEDLSYARTVCETCDVELEVVSLQHEYHDKVVSLALNELKAGRTPSPDIFCNERIKFGAFFEKLHEPFDKIASGHYARISEQNGQFILRRAPDPVKDQTYFLSNLKQEQLKKILFPIGHLTKAEVRNLAMEHQLATADRKDSQGICFLGKIQYRDFVKFHLGEQEGELIERETGKRLGQHKGYWFHTIGQRKGLGLGGGPWFVVDKDTDQNIVYISHAEHVEEQYRSHLKVSQLNWINGTPIKKNLQVKLRHGPEMNQGKLTICNDHETEVELEYPDGGISPGQHCIFYDDEICLGGGVII